MHILPASSRLVECEMSIRWSSFHSSDRCIRIHGNLEVFSIPRPHLPARSYPSSHRRMDAVRTNDGILDSPTIDAACAGVERARLNVQIIKDFTD